MSDKFVGGSNEKRLAVHMVHERIALEMGARHRSGKHVVLVGPQGGCVAKLVSMGLKPSIVAVDRDSRRVDAARARWPDVDIRNADVGDVAESLRGSISSCFLDLCNEMCDEQVNTIRRVQGAMEFGSVLAIEILKGREKGALVADWNPPGNRAMRRKLPKAARLASQSATRIHPQTPEVARQSFREAGDYALGLHPFRPGATVKKLESATSLSKALSRLGILSTIMNCSPCGPRGVYPALRWAASYQSRRVGSNGSPMAIGVWRMIRVTVDSRDIDIPGRPPSSEEWVPKTSWSDILELARSDPDRLGLALNLEPRTIAALKAHATRGTYDHGAA